MRGQNLSLVHPYHGHKPALPPHHHRAQRLPSQVVIVKTGKHDGYWESSSVSITSVNPVTYICTVFVDEKGYDVTEKKIAEGKRFY